MKRSALLPSFLLGAMLLGACSQPEPIVHLSAIPEAPPAVVSLPTHARYHRIDRSGDTLRVNWPSPDKGMTMCYVYVRGQLRYIDVFDYAGETAEGVLDFRPKYYQILVDGRTEVPDRLRKICNPWKHDESKSQAHSRLGYSGMHSDSGDAAVVSGNTCNNHPREACPSGVDRQPHQLGSARGLRHILPSTRNLCCMRRTRSVDRIQFQRRLLESAMLGLRVREDSPRHS